MLSHTVKLNDRDPHWPRLTPEEAAELAAKGFRFCIYQPESGEFALSTPHRVAEDLVHKTLTFMQEER
jgi:hypothetical protein